MHILQKISFFYILLWSLAAWGQTPFQKYDAAANYPEKYLNLLKNKKVGLVTNHTGIIQKEGKKTTHLVDFLLKEKIQVERIFAPEHGFRGKEDAGAIVSDDTDSRTGLSIVSLYGKNKKPKPEQLKNIDVMLFDIQDVGVRFYTYISTLHYVMEACAEAKIPLIVLDRPNPNGHYIDGPVLDVKHKSFIGMHPVPIVYGMTIGEYAQMINGEKWLAQKVKCSLTVVPIPQYNRQYSSYLPIKPSPNLPNAKAINLYPSLCLFEGTLLSVGRGTPSPFEIYGSPHLNPTGFTFTPEPNEGDKKPLYNGLLCNGENLHNEKWLQKIELKWLINAYQQLKGVKVVFFKNSFDKLAGNTLLREQILRGETEQNIRKSWQKDLEKFQKIRKKYLIYTN